MAQSRYSYQPKPNRVPPSRAQPNQSQPMEYPLGDPPVLRAWMALALPLAAWLSQVLNVLLLSGAPAELNCFAAFLQFFLLVFGLCLGISVLVNPGSGGVTVYVPAVFGIIISAGTLLLCLVLFVALLVTR